MRIQCEIHKAKDYTFTLLAKIQQNKGRRHETPLLKSGTQQQSSDSKNPKLDYQLFSRKEFSLTIDCWFSYSSQMIKEKRALLGYTPKLSNCIVSILKLNSQLYMNNAAVSCAVLYQFFLEVRKISVFLSLFYQLPLMDPHPQ